MLSDNDALNALVGLVQTIERMVRGDYDSIQGGIYTVSLADPKNRAATPTALKTVVVNLGSVPVRIYENGILVEASLAQNAKWVSPTNGGGAIKIDTASTGSNVSLATYILA